MPREQTMPQPVALITGSARRRLGWFVAQALARRGYAVVIHYNTSAEQAQAAAAELMTEGGRAVALAANLANEEEVRKLVADTLSEFGRIDVLVNCAAVWKPKALEDVTAAEVRGYLDANTLGTFLCCQHVGLAM